MIIRQAVAADYDAIVDVWRRSWDSIGISNEADKTITREMLRTRISEEADKGWSLYVAETDNMIVGILALETDDNHIDQLFVAPDAQSNSVGRALLAHARELMPDEIWLSAATQNARACRWYEREGFVLEKTEWHPEFQRETAYYRWKAD